MKPSEHDAGKFVSPASSMTISQCGLCAHKRAGRFCDAFPDGAGIPQAMFDNTFDHREPHAGDHGVRFEPARR